MLKRLLKLVVILLVMAGILGAIASVVMSMVAGGAGVRPADYPARSLTARTARDADQTAAWSIEVDSESFPSIATVQEAAFVPGEVATRSAQEVVFRSESRGVTYVTGFLLTPGTREGRARLTLASAVIHETGAGRNWYRVFGLAHRRLLPFRLALMTR